MFGRIKSWLTSLTNHELTLKQIIKLTEKRDILWGSLYVDRPEIRKYVGSNISGETYRLEILADGSIFFVWTDRMGEQIKELYHSENTLIEDLPRLAEIIQDRRIK